VAAAAGIVVGLAVVAGRHRTRSHRSAVEAAAAVPDVLDALSRSLRAGGSIRQAVADVALVAPPPHDTALADVAAAAASGRSLSSALKLWPAHLALPSVVFAVAVLHLCLEVGGPSAPTIDRAAAAIRDRLAVDRERDALTSQARLSALVVVAAPVAFGLLPDGGGGSVAGILFASPLGWSCLGSALVLDALGWWWMTRLTRPAVDAVTRAVPR
jgi:tight adherence protein B